ncbi:hypothetical protein [Actinophytocola oryzae]|uniref:Uncharacterized protein n=1 Tax=Actinophytocola oryzae TaxID=502181 RepID=A0A4R7V1S4_9PSEU|nr:hypothetical protein [Actinophytocola oryzae]TDV41366.1 hypothetical protein CLV71_12056 [Actinophytocola oryzae]
MDRLTTGRRHVRAGSVTVTELLSRQASPTHCTDSSPATPDDDSGIEIEGVDDVTETIPVVSAVSHRREPARAGQMAKLASLGVAGVVLCGAVTISSLIADQRRDASHNAMRPAVQITGEQALLPDQLDRTLPRVPTSHAVPRSPSVAEQQDTAVPSPSATPAAEPDTGTTASGSTASVDAPNDLELVRQFYGNLPEAPIAAFDLLESDGLGMNLGEFLSSWSTVTKIDSVKVVQRADGVLATVRMRLLGGGQLRLEQLVTVAESPRRIVGVQLLSAQRN